MCVGVFTLATHGTLGRIDRRSTVVSRTQRATKSNRNVLSRKIREDGRKDGITSSD